VSADIRYVRYRAWWLAMGGTGNGLQYAYVAENLLETWVPRDRSQDWLLHRTLTGRRRWLVGDESQPVGPGWPTGEWRAPYGDFYATEGNRTPAESAPGLWHRPNPAWLDDLPRDPELLLAQLRAALPSHLRSETRLLSRAADALRTGELPADLIVALFQGLAGLPGVTIRESVANLDGRLGTALVAENEVQTNELIFAPDAGGFLGERITLAADSDGMPAGTMTTYTSMDIASAEVLGVAPPQ
jgi:hypothetical protein